MKFPELKAIAALTFIMPIFFAVMWVSSAAVDGSWTFGVNSLSDMGISDNAVSAFLFNFGCIVTGISGIVIGLGLFAYGKRTVRVSGILYIVSMFFLALVGVFTLDNYPMHSFVASSFGLTMYISIIVSSVSDWRLSWYLYFDVVFITTTSIIVATQPFPMWEALLTIASMIWIAITGYKIVIREESLFGDVPRFGSD